MSAFAGDSSAAVAAFSGHASEYTAQRRRLVPGFDAFYGTAVEVVGLVHRHDAPLRVLDLGAGTGLMSAAVAAAVPAARLELLDASEPMLAEARARLGDRAVAVHVGDMASALPAGPFDAVDSALAIHHLLDAGKRALFARVREALADPGVFLNAEQLAAPTPALTDVYTERWVQDCRALGASEAEIEDARARMAHDRCADLESQLGWLREAGFAAADCFYRSWRNGVYAGFTREGGR